MVKTVSANVMYIAAIIAVLSLAFWTAAMFFGWLADDVSSPPGNERSYPAPKSN